MKYFILIYWGDLILKKNFLMNLLCVLALSVNEKIKLI